MKWYLVKEYDGYEWHIRGIFFASSIPLRFKGPGYQVFAIPSVQVEWALKNLPKL